MDTLAKIITVLYVLVSGFALYFLFSCTKKDPKMEVKGGKETINNE